MGAHCRILGIDDRTYALYWGRVAGESFREMAAGFGRHGLDFDLCCLAQAAQEVVAAGFDLLGVDAQKNPAHGEVNGYEQVTPLRLVRHLRQLLAVHMHEARLVVFEGFGWTGGGLSARSACSSRRFATHGDANTSRSLNGKPAG